MDDVLDVDMSLGLRTATQKSLIIKVEEDFKAKEAMKKMLADVKSNFEYDSFLVSGSRSKRERQDEDKIKSNYNSNTDAEKLI